MPNSAQLFPGMNKQFNAVVENASSSAVTWQLSQPSGGNTNVGTISTSGYYTAPNTVQNQATVTVTAVLQADPSKTGTAIVSLQSLSSIQGPLILSPKLSSLTTSQTLQLNVLTAGVTNTEVNWAVDGVANGNPAVGTISPSGAYSSPLAAGSHLITAILIANPNSIGLATVHVTDFRGMLTWRNDNSHSGINNQELALAPATVNSSTFGKIFSCPIDGYAYAQPLYVPNLPVGDEVHNVIFVATEKDSVYAFDADAIPCVQLWQKSLILPGSEPVAFPNLTMMDSDIVPFVGITGTPVIDTRSSKLYVVAATQTIATAAAPPPNYSHRLYILDLSTGSEIQAAGVGIDPADSPFDSSLENQRPALLFDNGIVYIAFGSYGGQCATPIGIGPCPYHGWLFAYDSTSIEQTGAFSVTPTFVREGGTLQNGGIRGGIWQSGGSPSADSNHNVYVATGDGSFNILDTNPALRDYSNSFLRLETAGGLSVADYFTPCDEATLESEGLDIGASAPLLLPDPAGSSAQPHLLIGGSKAGNLYVVNRDQMGKYTPAPPAPPQCSDSPAGVQTVPVSAGLILSTPLFWNNAVYVAPGNKSRLMSFPMSGGILSSSPSAIQSPETLGPQGATPVISSNGTINAILWLIDTSGAQTWPTASGPAILRAYDPNNLSHEVYSSPTDPSSPNTAGPAVKFTVPTVANGKVYVGTQTELDVYGLLQ